MTFVQDSNSLLLQEKKESQRVISVQSMVTCVDEEDIYDYPPIVDPFPSEIGSSEDLSSSSHALLEQVAGKLERQKSCESVESLSEGSCTADEGHEGSFSDEGGHTKRERDEEEKEKGADGGICERSKSVVSDAASEECALDSGIEAEKDSDLPAMVVPDLALMEKITTQVEFYFSNENVVKDKFLLKHIRRNKEGYVSLKLVSSFKKVKQLTKDWRVVAYSLERVSSLIQINDPRTKIRRVQPLPEIDDSPITCAVLALHLPLEKPSVESVSKLFGEVGDISFVRVLRAGGALPPDIKSLLTKYPILGEKHCAWIEFETPEAAKAATGLTQEDSMKVVLIVPESQKKQEKKQQQQQVGLRKNSATSKSYKAYGIRKGSLNNSSFFNGYSYNNYYSYAYNGPFNGGNFYSQTKGRKDSYQEIDMRRPNQRRKAVSLPSNQHPFFNDPRNKARPKSKSCTDFPAGSSPTSWVQRHLLAAAAASAASAASPAVTARPPNTRVTRISTGSLPLPEGIIRFPKGPDGSKGFPKDHRLRQIPETHF